MKKKLRSIYNFILCGYRDGGKSRHVCFTGGYKINMESRRGRFVFWLLQLDTAIRRGPYDFRQWLADQLSRAALRLRKQKVSVFGYYDHGKGNRAAELADEIWITLVCEGSEIARANEDKIEELASLAGATWFSSWRDGTPETKQNFKHE